MSDHVRVPELRLPVLTPTQQALRESGARVHSVVDSAPIVLWSVDAAGVFTFSDGRGLESLGLRPGEVVGRSIFEAYADVPQVLDDVRRALAGEDLTSSVELGGAAFEVRYSPVRDGSGAVVGATGAAIDVTGMRRARAEVERSLSLLRATLESTADGILVVDGSDRIVGSNRRLAEMWGVPAALLEAGDAGPVMEAVLPRVHEPEAFLARIREIAARPERESHDVLELRDGRVFERYSQPQRMGSEVVGRVWSFRDVTERRRAERELEARAERAARFQAALMELARSGGAELDEALRRIVRVDADTLGVERVGVWLFDSDGAELRCRVLHTRSGDGYASGASLRAADLPDYFRALRERRVLATADAATDPATHEFAADYLRPLGIASMLDIPVWRRGEMVGVVCHEHVGPRREWSIEEQDFAASVSDLVSLALEAEERDAAEREARRTAARMKAVAAAAAGVVGAPTREALRRVLEEACRGVVPFDAFFIMAYDPDAHTFHGFGGEDAGVYTPPDVVSAAGTPGERVVRERRSLVTLSSADAEGRGATVIGTGRRSESVIRTPILGGDGVLGIIAVQSYTPGLYTGEDVEVLEVLASLAATALENIRLFGAPRAAREALRRAHDELEDRVEARTAELAEANLALEEEIAERMRAEEELRAKSSELEAVFRALPDLYFRMAPDGTILDYQAGNASGLLLGPEEFLGRRMQELLPEDAAREFQDGLDTVVRTGELVCVEYPLRVPRGRRDFEARFLPLAEDQVIAVVRDVSEQKEAERALQESEQHFRRLIENSSDVATVLDPRGVSTYQSPSVERVFGYTAEEMLGTSAFDRIHPEDAPAAAAVLRAIFTEPGTVKQVEFRYRHKDGSWRVVEALGRTLLPDSADAGVVINGRDVTERRVAEEALRRSEERFRALIENASDLITILEPDGTIRYQSPAVEPLFGYTQDELVGENAFQYVHPDDVVPTMERLAGVVAAPGTAQRTEFRWLHRDGEWRIVEAVGRTLSPTSAAAGLVVTSRDVTERRRAEAALQQAKEEAEQANRAKSEFLSRMSHELRTPMNSILGFAQVLARRGLPEDQQRAVEHILKAGRHLLNLINEVLDIARIEANRQPLSLEAVDADAVVEEALALIRPVAAQRSVTLHARYDGCGRHVQADRQRLAQVLLNLLSNAVKYNRPGGSVEMVCRVEEGGERLRLEVRDTGPGIPAERMGELFVPFARLGAEQSDVEGTGLGLALSQRLTEAMGGRLAVESRVGEGSTFAVELRVVDSPLERLRRAGPEGAGGTAAVSTAPAATVLYIEDNLANLSLLETVFAASPGVTLVPALQGRLGVELALEHAPDLILLDLHLPDIPGDEVLRRLRADPRTRDVPVVVISADAMPNRVQRLLAEGAFAFLTKPIELDLFLETVERALAARDR
ncbi:MAG TPA: PAS domain S-box protein [Longimicrobiaceae bacterium]